MSILLNIVRILGLIWSSAVLITACSDEDVRHVDDSLLPYFETFEAEAAKRGVTIDFDIYHVEGYITDISVDNVVGQCSHTEEAPNAVLIDPALWKVASTSRKEQVIFHELGHCYLQRGHNDTTDNKGVCMSIMHSSAQICNIDYEKNREIYLDELFR